MKIADGEKDVSLPRIELRAFLAPALEPPVKCCAKKGEWSVRHLLVLPAKSLLLQIGLIG